MSEFNTITETIKDVNCKLSGQVSIQIIRLGKNNYSWRNGTYADNAISLAWTSDGYKLPSQFDSDPYVKLPDSEKYRRMTTNEAKRKLIESDKNGKI